MVLFGRPYNWLILDVNYQFAMRMLIYRSILLEDAHKLVMVIRQEGSQYVRQGVFT